VFAIGGEQVERIDLAEARGIQVAADGLLARQDNDDLLVRGSWSARFQVLASPRAVKGEICDLLKVMLC